MYTIILLKYVCLHVCLYVVVRKLEVAIIARFASQFGLELFGYASVQLNEPATCRIGENLNVGNRGHSGDRLSQKAKKQHVKTATTIVYSLTA